MLFIPSKIRVGYQERRGTYTGKLAYVTYYDDRGKVRKQKSWNSWRNNKIEPNDFDNTPIEGFVLNKKSGDYSSSWGNHRQAYCRVYDPRGFEFEITVDNLLFILENTNCIAGKGLEGEFVYSWDGKDLILLPTSAPDYKSQKAISNKLNNNVFVSTKDLIIGATYQDNNNDSLVYMGRFDYYTYKPDYSFYVLKGTATEINKGKYHWFIYLKDNKFIQLKTTSRKIISCINDTCIGNYAELFDVMEHNWHYSPFDYVKYVKYLPGDTLPDIVYDVDGNMLYTNKAKDGRYSVGAFRFNQHYACDTQDELIEKYSLFKREIYLKNGKSIKDAR